MAIPNSFGVDRRIMRNKRLHFNTPRHAHELTFSCYQKKQFLLDEQSCLFLADAVNLAREKHHLKIWAYVFMPNHVHLLLYPERDVYSISAILLTIKQSASRRILIHTRKHNPIRLKEFSTGQASKKYRFWQDGGGYDRNIISRTTLMKVIDYIHNNPLRKGLVNAPEEWKWSSFPDWYNEIQGPIPIDNENIPLI